MNPPSHIEFDRLWLLFRKKWRISSLIILAGCTCGLIASFVQEKVYFSEGTILIKRKANTSSLTGVGEGINEKEPLYQDSIPLETEAAVISSLPVLELAIDSGNLQKMDVNGEPLTAETLLEDLEVKQIQSSDLLRVSFADKDPKYAARVVNAILSAYLQINIQNNQNDAASARQFIEKEIPQAEANLMQAELALEQFKSQNKFLDSQQAQQSLLREIDFVKEQITRSELEATRTLNEASALLGQIGISSEEALSSTKLSQSQGVQDILSDLQETQAQIATSGNSLRTSHPRMIDLLEREEALREVLRQRASSSVTRLSINNAADLIQSGELQQNATARVVDLRAQYLSAKSQVDKLTQILRNHEQQTRILPKLQRSLDELNRRRETAQLTHSSLINKQEELRVAENQNSVNARIISPAKIPKDPVNPSVILYFLVGGFLGSVLSLANLLFIEVRDKSLRSIYEVQQIYGYRLLSVIPFIPSINALLHQFLSPLNRLEDIRTESPRMNQALTVLCTNFIGISSELNCRVIGVTSTVAGEGKSTVAAVLSKKLAEEGKNTLIIDANFNNPIQHHLWRSRNSHGLWNYLQLELINSEIECKSIEANLNLLSTGSQSIESNIPVGSFSFSAFTRLNHLVDILKERYDYIILDCPDILSNSAITSLNKAVDGFVLIVRPEIVDTENALLAKNLLTHTQSKVLGLVVNSNLENQQILNQANPVEDLEDEIPFEQQLHYLFSKNKPTNFDYNRQNQYYDFPSNDRPNAQKMGQPDSSKLSEQISLQRLEFWIDEQEQEVAIKREEISDLQDRLYNSKFSNDREILELKITEEKEKLNILEESLEGQRRQIRERLELLSDI